VSGRDLGARRPVPVAGPFAGRGGDGLAQPDLGRPGDFPGLRDRGRGCVCAPWHQLPGGDADWLPIVARWRGGDLRRDRDQRVRRLPRRRHGRRRRLRPGLPGCVPHDHRPGLTSSASRPGDRRLCCGLPRVQRPGPDRRRGGNEVRAALHGPGLLRRARRAGRGRGWHPGVPPRPPARASLARRDATRPVH
jgi:hypothetical protein